VDIYQLRVKRYSELLNEIYGILAGYSLYEEKQSELSELTEIANEFRKQDDVDVRKLGEKTLRQVKELRKFAEVAKRHRPDSREFRRQYKRHLRIATPMTGLIERIERRLSL
jgi:hypothetical protein